jgi:hypothetical protein
MSSNDLLTFPTRPSNQRNFRSESSIR